MTAARVVRNEHWERDVGTGDVAVLLVPAVMAGDRLFDVDINFAVDRSATAMQAFYELLVEIDGAREWTRRVEGPMDQGPDTLDYHCRRLVPAGRPMRIRAITQVRGARRLRLKITAESVTTD